MKLRRLLSHTLAALALAIVLVWAGSRVVTDRWWWSQYPWWVPTWMWAGAAAGMLGLSALFLPPRRRRLPWLGITGVLVMAAYLALVECRVYRLIRREALPAAAARAGGLRVLFWNPSSTPGVDLPDQITRVESDLVVIANPAYDRPFSEAASRYGRPWYVSDGQFVIFSRKPVLRWGSTSLGLRGGRWLPAGADQMPEPRWTDPGHAMWLEIEAGADAGGNLIVWVLDMPSDERMGRWATAEYAARVIRSWPGPATIPDGRGGSKGFEQMVGFPAPDVVLGDLNEPRGSASVGLLAPGGREAYAQAGAGYVATFPREHPLLQIDQVLTGPRLKATDYRVLDPGVGRHWMQWARVEVR